jgi:hypothetical protein
LRPSPLLAGHPESAGAILNKKPVAAKEIQNPISQRPTFSNALAVFKATHGETPDIVTEYLEIESGAATS